MRFTKMHGLGNDYVYVDGFRERVIDAAGVARAISDRHRGIGSDGLILIQPSDRADVRMEMYNADGSRGQMCGNGIRCVAKYAYDHGLARANPMRVEPMRNKDTGADGRQRARRAAARRLGPPRLRPADLPTTLAPAQMNEHPIDVRGRTLPMTCVSMGNPHAVLFVDALEKIDLAMDGRFLEIHPVLPRTVQHPLRRVNSRGDVSMITWERGSGATQACGTGACAVCVAACSQKRTDRVVAGACPAVNCKSNGKRTTRPCS